MKNFTPPPIRPTIHPRTGLGYRIDHGVRSAVPCLFVFFATLVLSAPLNLPGQVELMPALVMGTVFLWSVFVPAAMPSLAVFVLGLWADILSFGPAGVMLLMMLIVHGVALSGRYMLSRVNFFVLWLVFGVVMVGVTALQWALCSHWPCILWSFCLLFSRQSCPSAVFLSCMQGLSGLTVLSSITRIDPETDVTVSPGRMSA